MVDCNGEGILFIEADANVTLEQLGDEINPPFPYWDEVTRLTCGGFILALLFNHTVLDGFGLIKFLKTLEEFVRGADSPSILPVWQHNILSARDSPRITCTHHEYEKVSGSKDVQSDTERLQHKSFYFGPKDIGTIQNNMPSHLKNSTRFEILAAFIWRCRTVALELDPDQIVRFSCVVNMRGKHYDILPPGYYGVGFGCPAVCTKVDDLCKNPLGYAVELVKSTKAQMNEEYIKSVADYMVIMGRPKFTPEGNFLVSNITRLGFDGIDLGWGKPLYGGASEGTSMIGYHIKYQNKDGDDGILVLMCLPRSAMERNNASPLLKGKDPVKVIREALSKALVFCYPLAGRLQEGPNRKLMVDCNGEGVFFIEADANVKLEQLGNEIKSPFSYWDEVTRLTCGGFILALLFNHTMLDAVSLMQFLKTLVEFAKGADSPSLMPVWGQNILVARNPPRITCIHHEYEHVNEIKDAQSETEPMEQKSLYFGPKEISAIRNSVPLNIRNSSAFELLAGCVWRSRTAALKLDSDQIFQFLCIANMRGKHYDILPSRYYGVGFACPAVCTKVDDLCKNPLGYAVDLVKKAKAQMNEEYIKSLADFMVIKGRPTFKIEGNFLVSDVSRLGSEELDFGWGKPVYGGSVYAKPQTTYLVEYRKKDGEDGILVLMCMPRSAMDRFEKELKKISQGSVEDLYKKKMKRTKMLSKF
ncbi:Benzyl alcohol O-benzoyltransferase [Melia azedarach]|uniref:Benzyl alcohol O-benzoyltransferase n=1 Tax=Melia azedarach TaxID=155640 RepID=A0ACC1YM09_MELAZ|nr:Benzyl alcohol O-benzoyltransferase [Melia azedarach]